MKNEHLQSFLFGAGCTLVALQIITEYRHKNAIHRRLNGVTNRLNSFGQIVQGIDHRLAEVRRFQRGQARQDLKQMMREVGAVREVLPDRDQVQPAGDSPKQRVA